MTFNLKSKFKTKFILTHLADKQPAKSLVTARDCVCKGETGHSRFKEERQVLG